MRLQLSMAAVALSMAIAAPAMADEPPAEAPKTEQKTEPTAEAPKADDSPPREQITGKIPEKVSTQKLVGGALGALGFLTTAVGGFLVISSLNIYNEAESRCKSRGCSSGDVNDGDKSRDRANIGGIVLVSGIAVLGGGIALWFTAPKSGEKPTEKKSDVQVGLAPSFGGLTAVGTF